MDTQERHWSPLSCDLLSLTTEGFKNHITSLHRKLHIGLLGLP